MKNYKETAEVEYGCEHCGRNFIRESTLLKHLCEQKRRWLDKDRPSNRIGYNAWKNYYNTHHPNKKTTEYRDFYRSHYYTAFVKFGGYCHDITAINPLSYAQWLLKNKIPIDSWASDVSYTKYLLEFLWVEDPFDAVRRTMETLMNISSAENVRLCDTFKYINSNKICHHITTGKISPWVLYNSRTGIDFLGKLDSGQTGLVFDYIHPERWNIKFKRQQEVVEQIKNLLVEIQL